MRKVQDKQRETVDVWVVIVLLQLWKPGSKSSLRGTRSLKSIIDYCHFRALSATNEKIKSKIPKWNQQTTTLSPKWKFVTLHHYSVLSLRGRRHSRSINLFSSRQCGFSLCYIFPCNLCGLNIKWSSHEDCISNFGSVACLGQSW